MWSLGQPAVLKTLEVWQRMSASGAVHQAHSGPDLMHSSQLEADVGQRGLSALLVPTRNNSRYKQGIFIAIMQHKEMENNGTFTGETKVIDVEQKRNLTLSTEAFCAAAVLWGIYSLASTYHYKKQTKVLFSTIDFIATSFPLATALAANIYMLVMFWHLSPWNVLQHPQESSQEFHSYIYMPITRYFSDSESNCDPSISAGVGFPWSWLGALASVGPRLSAGITSTLLALRIQSSGGHSAAQGEIRGTLSWFKSLISI